MSKRIAVFGGSLNPSGTHHQEIARALSPLFDEVVVVPCGPRPTKPSINDVEPIHRAVMADLTFRRLPNVRVDLFDLEQETFTRTIDIDARYRARGEVWHLVGSDLVQHGARGMSEIQREWRDGRDLWQSLNFVVQERRGYPVEKADLPPRHRLISPGLGGSSTDIRAKVFAREAIDGLVTPEVAGYIERYGLYRGAPPAHSAVMKFSDRPRPLVCEDVTKPDALEAARRLREIHDFPADPNCIVAVGGDGFMLQTIREHWRKRLPFIGVNFGRIGFLLNEAAEATGPTGLNEEFRLHRLPLLYVEARRADGTSSRNLAFNDAWVERATTQSAWLEVKVNGVVRLPHLVADSALVATAAGSTAYARHMGASPLPANTPLLTLAAGHVQEPDGWKPACLPIDSKIEIRSLGGSKRPITGVVDGVDLGEVESMSVRTSRIAAVELGFMPGYDMAAKLARLQFPSRR